MHPDRAITAAITVALAVSVAQLAAHPAAASQIASRPLAEVVDESAVVVVGVVERVERLRASVTEGERLVAHVRVVSTLRGEASEGRFRLPLHVGGRRGFDTRLSEGDQAIFFLRSLAAGEAALQTWSSLAVFPKGHFHPE